MRTATRQYCVSMRGRTWEGSLKKFFASLSERLRCISLMYSTTFDTCAHAPRLELRLCLQLGLKAHRAAEVVIAAPLHVPASSALRGVAARSAPRALASSRAAVRVAGPSPRPQVRGCHACGCPAQHRTCPRHKRLCQRCTHSERGCQRRQRAHLGVLYDDDVHCVLEDEAARCKVAQLVHVRVRHACRSVVVTPEQRRGGSALMT